MKTSEKLTKRFCECSFECEGSGEEDGALVSEVEALEDDNARLRETWTMMLSDCHCGEAFTARGMHSTTCAVYHAASYAPDAALEAKD